MARKNVILFLLVILVGAYLYFFEYQAGIKKEKRISEEALLIHVPVDSVVKLEVKNTFGDFEFTKNAGGHWWIVRPVETKADPDEMNNLISELKELKRNTDIEPVITDSPAEFGLSQPLIKLRFFTRSGEQDSLWIGDFTPVGTNVFVSKGDSLIFTTPKSIFYTLDKNLYSWRFKKILDFKQADIDSIVIEGKNKIFLSRSENGWMLPELDKKADEANVSTILSNFSNTNIREVLSESSDNMTAYSLHKPSARVKFIDKQKDGLQEYEAWIGKKINDKYAVMDRSRPMIFTVDSSVVKPLFQNQDYFRDHDFADFDRAVIDSITISGPDFNLQLVKDSTQWYAVLDSGKVKVKNWKVSGLLSDLDFAQITGFEHTDNIKKGEFGLANPALIVRFFGGQKLLDEFFFGNVVNDFVYAFNPKIDEIVRLKKSVMDNCRLKLEDLKEE